MTEYIEFEGKIITASTDAGLLRYEHEKGNPVLLILDESNKDEDTSFSKYAVTLDEQLLSDEQAAPDDQFASKEQFVSKEQAAPDENDKSNDSRNRLLEAIDNDYLRKIVYRNEGKPIIIGKTKRLVIRELVPGDYTEIYRIFKESDGFIEGFFDLNDGDCIDSYEEIRVIISDYIRNMYDFYGYGIWGICFQKDEGDIRYNILERPDNSEDSHKVSTIIGIAGLTPRDENTSEIGYALLPEFRANGYAFEACDKIVSEWASDFAIENIVVRVNSSNKRGIKLAKKLAANYEVVHVEYFE